MINGDQNTVINTGETRLSTLVKSYSEMFTIFFLKNRYVVMNNQLQGEKKSYNKSENLW